jgi:hypothetical protein
VFVPVRIRIAHEEYGHTANIGRCADGRQFMIMDHAAPVDLRVLVLPDAERELALRGRSRRVAKHFFDRDGYHLESRVDDLGPLSESLRIAVDLFEGLGVHQLSDITIRRFQTTVAGETFGLIRRGPWYWPELEFVPYSMFFYFPWNGMYDT